MAKKGKKKGKSKKGKGKKKPDYHQTGTSNPKYDRRIKAKKPGRRRSASGRYYTERRKNRSDKPPGNI